jgi:hypothetical protein
MKKTRKELIDYLLANGYKEHHTAKTSGYVSRKDDAPAVFERYNGRFGRVSKYTAHGGTRATIATSHIM